MSGIEVAYRNQYLPFREELYLKNLNCIRVLSFLWTVLLFSKFFVNGNSRKRNAFSPADVEKDAKTNYF